MKIWNRLPFAVRQFGVWWAFGLVGALVVYGFLRVCILVAVAVAS